VAYQSYTSCNGVVAALVVCLTIFTLGVLVGVYVRKTRKMQAYADRNQALLKASQAPTAAGPAADLNFFAAAPPSPAFAVPLTPNSRAAGLLRQASLRDGFEMMPAPTPFVAAQQPLQCRQES